MKAGSFLIGILLSISSFSQDSLTWEVGGYASADWGYRYMTALNDTTPGLLTNVSNANSQDRFGLRGSFGFTYSQQFSQQIRLYTGIGYSVKGFTSFNNVSHIGWPSSSPYDTSFSASNVEYHNYSYMYHYLEIPFGVGFMFAGKKHWSTVLNAGVYGGIMILAKNPRCKGDTPGGNPNAAQYFGDQTENRHSIQASSSLMFRRHDPKTKMAIEFGPEIRFSLFNTHFLEDFTQHKSYLYSFNFKLRITGVFTMKSNPFAKDAWDPLPGE